MGDGLLSGRRKALGDQKIREGRVMTREETAYPDAFSGQGLSFHVLLIVLHRVLSKTGDHPSNITITVELVRKSNLEPALDLLTRNLHFNKMARLFVCPLKFEKLCSRLLDLAFEHSFIIFFNFLLNFVFNSSVVNI